MDDDDEDVIAFQTIQKEDSRTRQNEKVGRCVNSANLDMNEDCHQKMVRELVTQPTEKGMPDDEIQSKNGEAGERIQDNPDRMLKE